MHWYARKLNFQTGKKAEWGRPVVICAAKMSVQSAKVRATSRLRHGVVEILQKRQGKILQKHRREADGRWQELPVVCDACGEADPHIGCDKCGAEFF